MEKKTITEVIREFVTKYGDPVEWTLAVKFKVLFDTIRTMHGQETLNSSVAGEIYKAVYSLSNIENSGVVLVKSVLKDHDWDDTSVNIFKCGKALLEFECYTDYHKGADTDWFLSVKLEEEQHG